MLEMAVAVSCLVAAMSRLTQVLVLAVVVVVVVVVVVEACL